MSDKNQVSENKNNKEEKAAVKQATQEVQLQNTILQEVKNEIQLLERSLINKDIRNILKVFKRLRAFKRKLKEHHFIQIYKVFYPNGDTSMFDGYDTQFSEIFDISQSQATKLLLHPEIDLYLQTLTLVFLVYKRNLDQALGKVRDIISRIKDVNKRHLDMLNSIVYFYYSRIYELNNQLDVIRNTLFEAYRSACIRHEEISQATLLNLILRNFLNYDLYEEAQNFVSKTQFPENKLNNEHVRYLYYIARIKAVRLEYPDAFGKVMQSIRKSPEHTALGFRILAQKLAIIVELLLGEIPSRSIFSTPDFKTPLIPYYKIVQSVIKGNLDEFFNIVKEYSAVFQKDKLLNLINRLQQNVIRTGLRRINISYSRISLQDIAAKLHLLYSQDVEFIVAKAIRDGVLNAEIIHEQGIVNILENKDLYSSQEPQIAYERRIEYCMNLYTSATKVSKIFALQYPHEDQSKYLETEKRSEINPEDIFKMVDEDEEF